MSFPGTKKYLEERARQEESLRILNTTLRSRAFLKIQDAISEGEIEGLVDGDKSVYLNETQLQNDNGDYNFQNIDVETRTGTQAQTYIEGFESIESEVVVGSEVVQATPITFTITDSNIDAARVIIQLGSLFEQETGTGNIIGAGVTIKIELQANGGGYVEKVYKEIVGKSTNLYEVAYRIELTGSAPWDIRVSRISDDASVTKQNKTYVKSYTKVIDTKLSYPNTALVSMKIDSAQFGNVPSRSYDIKGIKVLIPDNYNPETRVYTGSWSGTFAASKAYTNNPAWVYYDILTNNRYGLGNFVDTTQVDKFALYSIAQYCDELVPDGTGSFEPRFTCNVIINNQEEAYKLLQNFTSVFRGMAYWSAGSLTAIQDAPSDPEYLFTNANVIDGVFNYSGASAKAKHSVCTVKWEDPNDFYREKIEWVEDQEAVAEQGIITTDIVAFGCTSRGQANRLARWLLYTEQNESRVVTFKTGTEGAILRPGMVIQVADSLVAGNRISGRIISATTSTVTLDVAYSGSTFGGEISCILPNGTVETKSISSVSTNVVTIVGTFSTAPASHSIWMISTPTLEPELFKVVSILESDDGTYDTTAVAHNPSKYDYIESNLTLDTRNITNLTAKPASPTSLNVTETLFQYGSLVRAKATLSWDKVEGAVEYQVQYSKDSDNVLLLPPQGMNELEILDVTPGRYSFTVVAINFIGARSIGASIEQELFGKIAPPENVTGFAVLPNSSNLAVITWDRATDLDVLIGGQVRIKYTPSLSPTWSDSVDIIEALSGAATSAQVPLLEGFYLAKFVDSTGNESVTEASFFTTVPYGNSINAVHTETEDPDFPGSKTDVEYVADLGGLVLSGSSDWDDITDLDLTNDIDFLGALVATGTYLFENTVDLGAVYPCRLTAAIDVEAINIDDFFDSRTDDMDTWTDVDGETINDVFARLYMRTTQTDTTASPTWTEWTPFFIGEFTARGFQFKLVMDSYNVNHNIIIKALSVTIDMPDRTEAARNVASGTSTLSVSFGDAFRVTPSIVITARDMATGDFYTITNQTTTGFDILFKNSASVNVNRNFDWVAKGYGRVI